MVLAISFLEAPIKFRAPGVTVPIGLGIGRLVFRAFNVVEGVLAAALLVAIALAAPSPAFVAGLLAIAALLGQLVGVRPRLNQRTAAVLAGETPPRSRPHHLYIALECLKAVALLLSGILLLAAV